MLSLEKITKYVFYLAIFLIPVFFLPLTTNSTVYNKQIVLSCFVFALLVLWIARAIINKKFSLNFDKLSLLVLIFVVILSISTIFSVSGGQSFFGQNAEVDSLFNFFLFALIFFFASQFLVEKKEVVLSISMIFLSNVVLLILFLLQAWIKIFPWGFAKNISFTPFDSTYALTFFSVGVFGLSVLFLPHFKEFFSRLPKIFFLIMICLQGFLTLLLLVSINSWIPWVGLIFISLVILWLELQEGFGFRKISLPLCLLILSFIFLLIKPTFFRPLIISPEVMLTQKTTLGVGSKTITEGVKEFLLGTGPATFNYQYLLHRSPKVNLTDFGFVRFSQGRSQFDTLLTTGGILGTLAGLSLLGVFLWLGIKKCRDKSLTFSDKNFSCFLFVGGLYLWVFWFLAPANFTLNFVLFLFMGLWLAISRQGGQKEINFSGRPIKIFVVILIFVALTVVSLLGLWRLGKQYAANLINLQGVKISSNPKNIDESINLFNKAKRLSIEDVYFRNLADAYLLKVKSLLENKTIAEKQRNDLVSKNVQLAIASADFAKKENPVDSLNWVEAGIVYENIIPLIKGAEEKALANYEEAARLNPQNPEISFQIARTHFTVAKKLKEELEILKKAENKDATKEAEIQKNVDNHLLSAKESLKKSLELKGNFEPAKQLLEQINKF